MIADTKCNDILGVLDTMLDSSKCNPANPNVIIGKAQTDALVAIANELAALNENVVWLAGIMPRG